MELINLMLEKLGYSIVPIIKNALFPSKCIICKKTIDIVYHKYLCPTCQDLAIIHYQCPRCAKPFSINAEECIYCKDISPDITAIKSVFRYKDKVRKSIFRWKYSGVRKYAKGYAQLFIEKSDEDIKEKVDGIIPVPISKKRLETRGFNQALDLSIELSKLIDVPVLDILERHKNTKAQHECSAEERLRNIHKSIRIMPNSTDILNKEQVNFIIVDDIYTTGSTIKECLRALKEYYNINKVYLYVVCIVG